MTDKLVKVQALADQAWKGNEAFLPDIERIAKTGLNGSERDELILRQVFYSVVGDIYMRKIAIAQAEESTPKGEPEP